MPATLVTGGGGFLGRAIVKRLLAEGRDVKVVGRSAQPDLQKLGVTFVQGDMADPGIAALATAGCETVFNVAAKAGVWGPYSEFYDANVSATHMIMLRAKEAGVKRFVHTSTPSVVYDGAPLRGAGESLPYTTTKLCPAAYPVTKAIAEDIVLSEDGDGFRTCALRPHLIWGVGDNHLVPRVVARARSGKLRIVGDGRNRVDMTHVDNAAHAHLLAEKALVSGTARGRAYFLSDDAPVELWTWVNDLLKRLDLPPVSRRVPVPVAYAGGAVAEWIWKTFSRPGEPPMTRFVATELAKDHWFSVTAAKRDLGYAPVVDRERAMTELVAWLRAERPCG